MNETPAPTEARESSSRRSGPDALLRWAPAVVGFIAAAASLALHLRWWAMLGVLVLVATAPVARSLAARFRFWAIGSLAATGLASVLPGVPITRGTLIALLALGTCVALGLSLRSRPYPWLPTRQASDAVLVAGAVAVFVLLALPYRGAGPDGALLDLARSFDNLSHYTMVHNLLIEESLAWTTGDGTPAEWANYYPLGLHVLGAFTMLLMGLGEPENLAGFGLASALGVSMSSLLLGFLAVDVAAVSGRPEGRAKRRIVAAAITSLALPLGGLLSGLFEVGHTAFLYPVTICVTASWLALSQERRPVLGLVVLALAAAGLMWSYPPLISGLIPGAAYLVLARARADVRVWVVGLGLVVMAAAAAQLVRWRWRFSFLADATGEFSTPVAVSLMMFCATGVLILLASRLGNHRASLMAVAPALGFGAAAASIAGLALTSGFPAYQNYYVAKLLQAVWVAALPVLIGLVACGVVALARRAPSRINRLVVAGGILGAGLAIAVIPDGRYPEMGGVALYTHRVLERDRALGQVQIVAASRAMGPPNNDAGIIIEPRGWFYRVAHEEPGAFDWVRRGSSATNWLNSLRGVKSAAHSEAASCLGERADASAVPCLSQWLERYPDASLNVAIPADVVDDAYRGLGDTYGDRVTLFTLP